MKTLAFVSLSLASLFLLSLASGAGSGSTKPTIVLVHGAWADGSSWQKVIPIMQNDGYPVIAVQNPLTSLPDDVATTKRVIDAQKGPIVVVGHSYAGAVITEAAAGDLNVKALVYVHFGDWRDAEGLRLDDVDGVDADARDRRGPPRRHSSARES